MKNIEISISMPETEFDQLIDDIMAGYPEAGSGNCLKCTDFKYKTCTFKFTDVETDKKYTVERPKLRIALKQMIEDLFKGELPGIGQYVLQDFKEAGNWDAYAADALVQYAIFEKVIYG